MTPDEFAKNMKDILEIEGIEMGHQHADDLIIELLKSIGYEEGAEIFNQSAKWYS